MDVFLFLKERGVDTTIIESENIDGDCLRIMHDEDIEKYIPKVGDRMALKNFLLREKVIDSDNATRKSRCLERIRKRLKLPSVDTMDQVEHHSSSTRPKFKLGNTYSAKLGRQVEFGWIHVTRRDEQVTKSSVKPKSGGGFRKKQAKKTDMKTDLLKLAQSIYFNDEGKSGLGYMCEFSFDMWDFQENVLPQSMTVGEMYKSTGLTMLRFYMITEPVNDDPVLHALEKSGLDFLDPLKSSGGSDEQFLRSNYLPDLSAADIGELVSSVRTRDGYFPLVGTNNSDLPAMNPDMSHTPLVPSNNSDLPAMNLDMSHTPLVPSNNSDLPAMNPDMSHTPLVPSNNSDLPAMNLDMSHTPLVPSNNSNLPAMNLDMSHTPLVPSSNSNLPAMSHTPLVHMNNSDLPAMNPDMSNTPLVHTNNSELHVADIDMENSDMNNVSSIHPFETGTPTIVFKYLPPESLCEALLRLSDNIKLDQKKNIVNVTRHDILDGAYRAFLRNAWDPCLPLSVKFAGEPAMDDGGVAREFLTLAVTEIANSRTLFHGEKGKYLNLDSIALEKKQYLAAGRILAYSLVHNGQRPNFFSEYLFKIANGNAPDDIPEDAIQPDQKELITKISESQNEENFNETCAKSWEWLLLAGCTSLTRFDRKEDLVKAMCKFIACERLHGPLNQFLDGLRTLGVLDALQKYPAVMTEAFLYNIHESLTAIVMADLFVVKPETWSPEGSNKRLKEATVYSFWLDYLQDLEDEGMLEDVLVFVTGAKEIPVMGFSRNLEILFRHECHIEYVKEYPVASTCALTLSLPLSDKYDTFKLRMTEAIGLRAFTME